MPLNGEKLALSLPKVRGRLQPMADLSALTWLRVGGPAEVLFSPADVNDLAGLLARLPPEIPVTPIGVGSNLIVRDGGVKGIVIRLGRAFAEVDIDAFVVNAGAAALDSRVAQAAAKIGVDGLSFLRGVPGTIGGALRMNAGCYGAYVADVFASATAVARNGDIITLGTKEMGFQYRDSAPKDVIYTAAKLKGVAGDPARIEAEMIAMMARRAQSQPVKDRTAGSTFRNPAGHSSTGEQGDSMAEKAWALIERAGCRGLRRGGAVMSLKHSNFLTNEGGATAAELEALGEEVRRRVLEQTGYRLDWEVQRIGLTTEEAAGE